jgi:hypothetical protein
LTHLLSIAYAAGGESTGLSGALTLGNQHDLELIWPASFGVALMVPVMIGSISSL